MIVHPPCIRYAGTYILLYQYMHIACTHARSVNAFRFLVYLTRNRFSLILMQR